ncbi:MAG: Txe/YoeB family addiction module toxin [Acutalibacteraceae bacterium]|nr:Txe/YoeB family addiction module toxin [Acutalibacteraceae bacterium]
MNGKYSLKITKAAQKDKEKIKQYPALKKNVQNLLDLLIINPFQNPPPYEKLMGNLSMCYSRRINSQHRLVYMVDEENKVVKIISMWTHYEF